MAMFALIIFYLTRIIYGQICSGCWETPWTWASSCRCCTCMWMFQGSECSLCGSASCVSVPSSCHILNTRKPRHPPEASRCNFVAPSGLRPLEQLTRLKPGDFITAFILAPFVTLSDMVLWGFVGSEEFATQSAGELPGGEWIFHKQYRGSPRLTGDEFCQKLPTHPWNFRGHIASKDGLQKPTAIMLILFGGFVRTFGD